MTTRTNAITAEKQLLNLGIDTAPIKEMASKMEKDSPFANGAIDTYCTTALYLVEQTRIRIEFILNVLRRLGTEATFTYPVGYYVVGSTSLTNDTSAKRFQHVDLHFGKHSTLGGIYSVLIKEILPKFLEGLKPHGHQTLKFISDLVKCDMIVTTTKENITDFATGMLEIKFHPESRCGGNIFNDGDSPFDDLGKVFATMLDLPTFQCAVAKLRMDRVPNVIKALAKKDVTDVVEGGIRTISKHDVADSDVVEGGLAWHRAIEGAVNVEGVLEVKCVDENAYVKTLTLVEPIEKGRSLTRERITDVEANLTAELIKHLIESETLNNVKLTPFSAIISWRKNGEEFHAEPARSFIAAGKHLMLAHI